MQMVKDHVGDAHEKLVAADDLNWIGFGLPYFHAPVMQKKRAIIHSIINEPRLYRKAG